jgi:hypothetical protein
MNLQQIANDLNYEKGRCENCHGRGSIPRRDANGTDAWATPGACLCKGQGYLWYPKQDSAIPRPFTVGIADEQLTERWQ